MDVSADYDETFSPVAMPKSVKIMLAIAAFMIMESSKWTSILHSLTGFLKKSCI